MENKEKNKNKNEKTKTKQNQLLTATERLFCVYISDDIQQRHLKRRATRGRKRISIIRD